MSRFRWPSSKQEQGAVIVLGLALIPLAMLIARSSKELCAQGQVMWEGQGVGMESDQLYLLRVVCLPKEGPFVGEYAAAPAPGAPPSELEWYRVTDGYGNERFQHVEPARQALEGVLGDI